MFLDQRVEFEKRFWTLFCWLHFALPQWLACPRPLLVAGDGELVHDSDVKWWKQLGISTTLPGIKHWPRRGCWPRTSSPHTVQQSDREEIRGIKIIIKISREKCAHTLFSHKMKIGWRHFLRWRTWSMTSRYPGSNTSSDLIFSHKLWSQVSN